MSLEKQKKNKLKILKYIILVLVTSIICFAGSLAGLKIIKDNPSLLSSLQAGYVGTFIGFFATAMFVFITLWIIIATFTAFFNIFKSEKRTIFWKLFGLIFLILTILLAAAVIVFCVLFLIDFVDFIRNVTFDKNWSIGIWKGFYNIMYNNNKYYICLFVFSIGWAISAILYNVAFNVLGNFKKEKKPKKQEVVEQQKEAQPLAVVGQEVKEENNNQVVNEIKQETVVETKPTPKVEEDDWLMDMYKETGTPVPVSKQSQTTSNEPKNADDPYSLFD